MKRLIFLCCLTIMLNSCSKEAAIDPLLQVKQTGLFTFKVVQEGDGSVTFLADSTQIIKEFTWDFGDGTTPTTLTTGKVSHTFTKNSNFQVKLTAKNTNNQISDSKTIIINNRLARTYDDIPKNERDTIRILYVLTSYDKNSGYKQAVDNPKSIENHLHLNYIFSQFIQRTSSNKEFDKLVFKGFLYTLSTTDTLQFYNNGDPDSFFKQILARPENALHQKILSQKKQVSASRVVFLMLNPIISASFDPNVNGIVTKRKYNYAGYAPYEGSYVAAFNNTGVVTHEMGHSFGFAHDNQRDSRYWPIMMGPETQVISNGNLLWTEQRELQIQGFSHQLLRLKSLSPFGGDFVVPQYWQPLLYPNNPVIEKIELKNIATTPYYKSGIDLITTLKQALIEQYNIKLAPSSVKSISEKLILKNGRIGIGDNAHLKKVQ